ncbi:MAG: M28 family peptidase [Bacteroidia bacterium]
MKYAPLLFLLFFTSPCFAQNQPPQIQNLQAFFSYTDNRLTLTYDLSDAEGDSIEIFFRLSSNGGENFQVDVSNAAGDVGFPVLPGTGKQITWDSPQPLSTVLARVKLTADDKAEVDIQAIVDQVDSTRLKADLNWIAGIRHPGTGLAHLQEVKDSIEKRFLDAGLTTYRQPLTVGSYTLENIIGLHQGHIDDSRTWIIDGHFDGVFNSPAADDNGTAVAGFLEAMRLTAPLLFRNNIRYIGFDQEEAGTLGSQRYVNQGIQTWETIEGVINLEMIGYYRNEPNTQVFPAGFNLLFPAAYNAVVADSSRGNFITNVAEPNSLVLKETFDSCAARYVPGLRVIDIVAPANPALVPDLLRSDHAWFWASGIPALMITDGANFRNPNYHTPGDSVGTLHFPFMQDVVRASVATLITLAQPLHGDVAVSQVGIANTGLPDLTGCGIKIFNHNHALQIETGDCRNTDWEMTLMSITGQILMKKTIPAGSSAVNMNLEEYAPGVYLLRLESRYGTYTERVVRM